MSISSKTVSCVVHYSPSGFIANMVLKQYWQSVYMLYKHDRK